MYIVFFWNILTLNKESQFTSTERLNFAQVTGTKIHCYGVESQNAIYTGEMYCAYLQRAYIKFRLHKPTLSGNIPITLVVKATIETASSDSLVP